MNKLKNFGNSCGQQYYIDNGPVDFFLLSKVSSLKMIYFINSIEMKKNHLNTMLFTKVIIVKIHRILKSLF